VYVVPLSSAFGSLSYLYVVSFFLASSSAVSSPFVSEVYANHHRFAGLPAPWLAVSTFSMHHISEDRAHPKNTPFSSL
jgi:hypothetical protein